MGRSGGVGKSLEDVFCIVSEETRGKIDIPTRRVLREGMVVNLANHTLLLARDGTERPIADSGAPIRNEEGQITGVVLVFRDQTDERRAEEALRESREQFRGIVSAAQDGIIMIDPRGCISLWNRSAERVFGYSAKEVLGRHLHNLIAPARFQEATQRALPSSFARARGPLWARCLNCPPCIKRKGSSRSNCRLCPCSVGRTVACGWNSPRHHRSQAGRTDAARQRSPPSDLFESSSDAVMTLAPPSWKFTSCNPATLRMFNVKGEAEFVSLGPWQVSPEVQPDGRPSAEKAKEMIETAMREGSHFFEWTHKRLGGEDFPATVLLTRMELAGQEQLQGTVRDVSSEKRAEEEQTLAIQRMESLLALNHIGDQPLNAIVEKVVEDAIRVTQSEIGYLAVLNEDESVLTMQYWSKSAHASCKTVEKPIVYPVEKTGLWERRFASANRSSPTTTPCQTH